MVLPGWSGSPAFGGIAVPTVGFMCVFVALWDCPCGICLVWGEGLRPPFCVATASWPGMEGQVKAVLWSGSSTHCPEDGHGCKQSPISGLPP